MKLGPAADKLAFFLFILLLFSLGRTTSVFDISIGSVAAPDLLFPLVLIVWLAAVALNGASVRWHSAFIAFVLYLVALIISVAVADEGAERVLAGKIYLVGLAVLTANIVSTFDRLWTSLAGFVAGSLVPLFVGLAGIVLFYAAPETSFLPDITYHYGAAPFGNFPRLNSTFTSPSMFCNYLTVAAVMSLALLRSAKYYNPVAIVFLVAISVCAVFTVSIALGGFFLAIGLWIAFRWSRSRVSSLAAAAGCLAAIFFLVVSFVSLENISSTEINPSSRVLVWREAVTTFSEHPLAGKGLGSQAANVTYRNSDGSYSILTDAHNTYLNVAAQSGLLGLLSLLVVIGMIIYAGYRNRTNSYEMTIIRRSLLVAFVAAFVYDGLTSSFEDARHLWVLMGLILGADNLDGKRSESIEPLH